MKIKRYYCILITLLIGLSSIGQENKPTDSTMVLIPAGEFMMGKNSEKNHDFSPSHKVKVDSFFMDRHEVTNEEYLRFCHVTNHKLPEFWNTSNFRSGEDFLNYPVIGINWREAKKYAQWCGKRLPTEAEWEYAARGGLINKDYPNGNKWGKEKAKQDSTGWKNLIVPVEKFEPNGFGLYDMGGNGFQTGILKSTIQQVRFIIPRDQKKAIIK